MDTWKIKKFSENYSGRWNIETTFQEMRSYLKLEKTRGWTERTVLRTAPCLFGLYSVIALWYAELPPRWQCQKAVTCSQKQVTTFSDAITAVRRWLWSEWIFANSYHGVLLQKYPAACAASCSMAPPRWHKVGKEGKSRTIWELRG